ncbi:MAG: transaminase [Alphaproteobacteria bacterium]
MTIDRDRIRELRAREDARLIAERPRSRALLERARRSMPDGVPMSWMVSAYHHAPMFVAEADGAYFTDVDGHRYLDMNLADTSMACGFTPQPVVEAVAAQMRRGSQFLLPTEDAIAVAEELARRFGLPRWQFTLAASSANTEVLRIARAATGRETILLFDGKYHGMLDETLFILVDGEPRPEGLGLPKEAAARTRIVQFNDLAAAEAALSEGDVACVVVEPALTNVGGLISPEPDFHAGLRALTRRFGSLLILDEVHTHVCAFGGLTRAWGLEPDIVVLGKALGGGVPIGAYGMAEELARFMEGTAGSEGEAADWTVRFAMRVATGGTMFANALSLAAAHATLEHVLTEEGHARTAALGERLADGIEAAIRRHGLSWSAYRLYCRSGYCFAPKLPRNNLEAQAVADIPLTNLMRVYMANHGVWEAVEGEGPAVSFAATPADIDLYLDVFERCLAELVD